MSEQNPTGQEPEKMPTESEFLDAPPPQTEEPDEVVMEAGDSPTVGEQAEYILNAPEGTNLPEKEREYLQQVARDLKNVRGILHQNPDGTYAPINTPDAAAVNADSSTGTVRTKPGYGFKEPSDTFKFNGEDTVYTNENLTHSVAKRIMKSDAQWFRKHVRRAYIETTKPYWEGNADQA